MSQEFDYDENIFSDLHKDAYGFRPRGHEFYQATPERKQEIWDAVCRDQQQAVEDMRRQEAEAKDKFEASIKRVMETCNCSWIRAFEILAEADGIDLSHIRERRPEFMYSYDYELEGWWYSWGVAFRDGFEYAIFYHDCKLEPVRKTA